MNHTSKNTNKTVVKRVGIFLLAILFQGFTEFASADCLDACVGKEGEDAKTCRAKCESTENNLKASISVCSELQNSVTKAKEKIANACEKMKVGSKYQCTENAIDCADASGEEPAQSTAQIIGQMSTDPTVQALGNAYGQSQNQQQSSFNQKCPQMSGRDYFTEKDKITKDLETTQEALAKLTEDNAKINDELNKQNQDLQDSLNKAQEELDKDKLNIKDKKRKQLTDFQNQQTQMKETLRKKSTEVLSLQGQLSQSQQDQALKLIAMTDASGKRACTKAFNDAKKAYDTLATSSTGSYIGLSKQRREDLLNTFNDCMDSFQQQRNALNKSKKQEQDQIRKAITDAQQSIEEMNNSLNTAQAQLTEVQNDAQTEEDQATQKVVKLQQTTQTKMLAAQQKAQAMLQANATKNQSLSQKLNRLNNSLMTLGAAPKSRTSDYSPEQASSDIGAAIETIEQNIARATGSTDPTIRSCFNKTQSDALRKSVNKLRGVN